MKIDYRLIFARVAFVAILLALGGCTSDTPEALLASAKGLLAKQDGKGAAIQLKNALQKNPDLAEARFLLGKTLLENGDAGGAEVELRKALELRYSRDLVVPLLANARLRLEQFQKVVDEGQNPGLLSAESKAESKTVLAWAYLALGKRADAERAGAEALVEKPDHANAMIFSARVKAAAKDFDSALAIVDKVLVKTPADGAVFKLKGDVLAAKESFAPAIAAYRKALELQADQVDAHAALIALLLQQRKGDDAKAQLDAMRKVAPRHPQTLFSQAMLAFVARDLKTAREFTQQLLRSQTVSSSGLQLAGAVEYQSGSYVLAEEYLSKFVKLVPESLAGRRWLALTYLGLGRPDRARATLEPVLGSIGGDVTMLALAGEVFMQLGDTKKGEEFLVRAAKLDPKDPNKRTAVAVARFTGGDTEAAFAELERISAEDSGTIADMALLATHMQRRQFDKALKSVDIIEKKKPNDAATHNLRGRVLLAMKDYPRARKSFEQALSLNPGFYPAAASLAGLDLTDNKMADAQARFERVIAADAKNSVALLALAELKIQAKAPQEDVIGLMRRSGEANPLDPLPRTSLVQYYLSTKDLKKAIAAGQEALAVIPDQPEILDVLGQAHQAAGEFNQALTVYGKLAALRPKAVEPYLRMADVHAANKNLEASAQSLRKALEIRPDLVAVRRGLATLDIERGRPQDAITLARQVQEQRPNQATGYLLEGDIGAARNAWDSAADAYRKGLKNAPTSNELALKLYAALRSAGKLADADKFAASWIRDNPKDANFRFALAELMSANGEYAAAALHYRAVLPALSDNAALFNNLAWVLGKLKDPGAIEYAEKANKIAPNQPLLMDTLGALLTDRGDKGDIERALDLLSRAVQGAPQVHALRLNYARALAKAGRKAEARKELDALVKLDKTLAVQAEASSLLREL